MTQYTAKGSIRGSCGHRHKHIHTAVQCAQVDQKDCSKVGGYSDRTVVRCDGEPLTVEEWDEIQFYDLGPQ